MGLLVSITLLLLADLRILWKCLICNTFCRDHFVYALSLIGWAHAQNNRCFWAPMPLTVPLHSPNGLAFWLKRGSIHCWEFSRIEHCNGCYFADKMFQHIFVKENIGILIEISLKFVLNHLIVLFPNPFSLSSEQPNNAFKSEQPTAGCIAIFHKYNCNIKYGGIITILTLWNSWGYVTDISHNAGIWSMD